MNKIVYFTFGTIKRTRKGYFRWTALDGNNGLEDSYESALVALSNHKATP